MIVIIVIMYMCISVILIASNACEEEGDNSFINFFSYFFSEDEQGDLGDDPPNLIIGHRAHSNLGCRWSARELETWTPLLSHQLFKALGRRNTGTTGCTIRYMQSGVKKIKILQILEQNHNCQAELQLP